MVNVCCVPLCGSNTTDKNISFHVFTKDKKLQKIWIHKIRRVTRKSKLHKKAFVLTEHTRICSKHFLPADFITRSPTRKVLKKTAVPSCFPWSLADNALRKSVFVRSAGYRKHHSEEVSCRNQKQSSNAAISKESDHEQPPDPVEVYPPETSVALTSTIKEVPRIESSTSSLNFREMYFDLLIEFNDFKKKTAMQPTTSTEQNKVFREISVTADFPFFNVDKFKEDVQKFDYYTGFQQYDIFKISLGLLFENSKVQPIKFVRSRCIKKVSPKLSVENQYFLTLVKLRRNFGYAHLSTLFHIGVGTVGNIFTSWINFMYLRLGSLDIWPHRDVLFKNYPADFCTKYANVIGFIDATEFYIQTPSSLVRQSQTYSQYKSHNTVKALVVSDANGAIMFISALFTGSISDNELMVKSGFIKMLQQKLQCQYLAAGDIFLADKGFRTTELLQNIDININIPVFKVTGRQFTPSEVELTRTIAHERIHVERSIRRLKNYKILTDEVPITLLSSFNQICTVCALLANMRYPLRS